MPDRTNQDLLKTYVPPRSPVEKSLCAVWCEALRLERVGVNDKFFELGGDSILSISVVAKARKAGLQLSVAQLFERQTIAELALVATESNRLAPEQGLVTGDIPLTPIQRSGFSSKVCRAAPLESGDAIGVGRSHRPCHFGDKLSNI